MSFLGDVAQVMSVVVVAASASRFTRTALMGFVALTGSQTLTGSQRGVDAAERAVPVQADDQRITKSGEDLCHHQGGDEKMLKHESIHKAIGAAGCIGKRKTELDQLCGAFRLMS